jgi:exodeoxyribonuclease-5
MNVLNQAMSNQSAKNIIDFLQFDSPTTEQKLVLDTMSEFISDQNSDDFIILCGAAGTGKTSITTALVGYMNHIEKGYSIAAPTGRAARILGRKANVLSETIYSMIYNPSTDDESGIVHFSLKNPHKKDNNPHLFIIDEASMINAKVNLQDNSLFVANNSLLDDIVKFVKMYHPKSKVLFLGDKNQLPPIYENDSYALMPEYLENKFKWNGKQYLLTEVKRQEDGSYIMKTANSIRKAIENETEDTDIDCYRFQQGIYAASTHYTNKFLEHGPDHSISIGCTHNSNKFFNDLVRQKIYGNKVSILEKGDYMIVTQTWERNGIKLYSGDHVIVEDFDTSITEKVANLHFMPIKIKVKKLDGTEVIVEDYLLMDSITNPNGTLPIREEKELRGERFRKNTSYRESKMPKDDRYVGALRLTYGHAITCNKAQGGEWNEVYLNTFKVPNLKWLYTGVTRAVNELRVYKNNN